MKEREREEEHREPKKRNRTAEKWKETESQQSKFTEPSTALDLEVREGGEKSEVFSTRQGRKATLGAQMADLSVGQVHTSHKQVLNLL